MQILNTIPIEVETGKAYYLSWSIGCILGLIFFIAVSVFMVFCIKWFIEEHCEDFFFLFLFFVGAIIAVITGACILEHPVMTPINQYEVIMDDTVPFVEVIEKYDFIEQHGDIYILQDKVPEK